MKNITLHRQQRNCNVPSPRNVVRISVQQSMWIQWLNFNFAKLRENFLCAKKTKVTLFIQQFFSPSYRLPTFWRVPQCMCALSPKRNQQNEERPPHMIVKRFGCTTIHNKALYKCLIHSSNIISFVYVVYMRTFSPECKLRWLRSGESAHMRL